MTDQALTDILAERVMGWRVTPDRFIRSGRGWLPKWRFAPLSRLDDAFQLLDRLAFAYKLERTGGDKFAVEVRSSGRIGTASGEQKARTITMAIVQALGLEVPN